MRHVCIMRPLHDTLIRFLREVERGWLVLAKSWQVMPENLGKTW